MNEPSQRSFRPHVDCAPLHEDAARVIPKWYSMLHSANQQSHSSRRVELGDAWASLAARYCTGYIPATFPSRDFRGVHLFQISPSNCNALRARRQSVHQQCRLRNCDPARPTRSTSPFTHCSNFMCRQMSVVSQPTSRFEHKRSKTWAHEREHDGS